MNENKIAFMICVNNESYYEECLFYLNRISVPEGFRIEVFAITEAESIFEAYNQAMRQSDAKYKIYMHQDVFLIDKTLVKRCIEFFRKHERAGMLGVIGGSCVPENRRFYKSWDTGYVIACSEKKAYYNDLLRDTKKVRAVDGMFMMTQYDLPWREDALTGWDFYDFSQSMEFRKAGFEVWVMGGTDASAFHDCGYLNFCRYDHALDAFLREYEKDFPDYSGMPAVYPKDYQKQFAVRMELTEGLKQLLFLGHEQEVRQLFEKTEDERFFNTEMAVLKNILEILEAERSEGIKIKERFLADCSSFDEVYIKYQKAKFYLRRKKYAPDDPGTCPKISDVAGQIIKKHCMPD